MKKIFGKFKIIKSLILFLTIFTIFNTGNYIAYGRFISFGCINGSSSHVTTGGNSSYSCNGCEDPEVRLIKAVETRNKVCGYKIDGEDSEETEKALELIKTGIYCGEGYTISHIFKEKLAVEDQGKSFISFTELGEKAMCSDPENEGDENIDNPYIAYTCKKTTDNSTKNNNDKTTNDVGTFLGDNFGISSPTTDQSKVVAVTNGDINGKTDLAELQDCASLGCYIPGTDLEDVCKVEGVCRTGFELQHDTGEVVDGVRIWSCKFPGGKDNTYAYECTKRYEETITEEELVEEGRPTAGCARWYAGHIEDYQDCDVKGNGWEDGKIECDQPYEVRSNIFGIGGTHSINIMGHKDEVLDGSGVVIEAARDEKKCKIIYCTLGYNNDIVNRSDGFLIGYNTPSLICENGFDPTPEPSECEADYNQERKNNDNYNSDGHNVNFVGFDADCNITSVGPFPNVPSVPSNGCTDSDLHKVDNKCCFEEDDELDENGFCFASRPDGLEYSLLSTTLYNNAYANDNDTNTVKIILKKSDKILKTGKKIVGLKDITKNDLEIEPISNRYGDNKLDTNTGAMKKPLDIETGELEGIGNFINIKNIKAYEPISTNTGVITINYGNNGKLKLKDVEYNFKKPFIGEIRVKNYNKQDLHAPEYKKWDGKIKLGVPTDLQLYPKPMSTLLLTGPSQPETTIVGRIMNGINKIPFIKINDDYKKTIGLYGDNLDKFQLKELNSENIKILDSGLVNFPVRIDTATGTTKIPKAKPGIQVDGAKIRYKFGQNRVEYTLSKYDSPNDETPVSQSGSEFLGVKVIGGLQGRGKSEFTGQEKNISDLYNFELRSQIRENAYKYIKNMDEGTESNGVHYYNNDIEISKVDDLQPNDTIVIKDSNLIIDENIDETIGIIVLKSNYDINDGYEGKGNIYIEPKVKKINAIIYADGAIVSVDKDEKILKPEDSSRTAYLNNQLTLNGSIFTRNTIGGALSGGNTSKKDYVLPGGQETKNYKLAAQYDLNFLRTGNDGCAKDYDKEIISYLNIPGTNKFKKVIKYECKIKNPFIIKYNSKVQLNPPKLFSIKK